MEELNGSGRSAGNIDGLLLEGSTALTTAGIDTPRLDAEVLLATACGGDRAGLYARSRTLVSQALETAFRAMLARRIAREPLAYIIGRQEFWSLDFIMTPDVLIPRPETELLVELAIGLLSQEAEAEPPGHDAGIGGRGATVRRQSSPHPLLCDLGTGCGCIAVALASVLPAATVWALDISPDALLVAAANARRHGVAERIRFIESDLFAAAGAQRFDVIITNPPYVSGLEMAQLQPEVQWEPRVALDGGNMGLAVIDRCLNQTREHLVDGGWLLMEIGAGQETGVIAMARAALLTAVSVRRDYAGLPRVLLARR
jgi:release factor glutamine methyltransferase